MHLHGEAVSHRAERPAPSNGRRPDAERHASAPDSVRLSPRPRPPMTTDAPVPPAPVETPAPAHPVLDASPTRRQARNQRRRGKRSWRGLCGAILVCAAVPTAVVLSLWSNLTEPFGFNEQWRAYYVSNPGNWFEALKSDGAPVPGRLVLPGAALELAVRQHRARPAAPDRPVPARRLRAAHAAGAPVDADGGGRRRRPGGRPDRHPRELLPSSCPSTRSTPLQWWRWSCCTTSPGGRPADVAIPAGVPGLRRGGPGVHLQHAGDLRRRAAAAPRCAAAGPPSDLRRADGGQQSSAGLIVLSHLVAFVLPQSARQGQPYWDPQFLPHDGIGRRPRSSGTTSGGSSPASSPSSAQSKLPGFVLPTHGCGDSPSCSRLLLCLGRHGGRAFGTGPHDPVRHRGVAGAHPRRLVPALLAVRVRPHQLLPDTAADAVGGHRWLLHGPLRPVAREGSRNPHPLRRAAIGGRASSAASRCASSWSPASPSPRRGRSAPIARHGGRTRDTGPRSVSPWRPSAPTRTPAPPWSSPAA